MNNIWWIVGIVIALQAYLIVSALGTWATVRGILANEAIVLERLANPKETSDEAPEAFFEKRGIKGSLLHSRWIAVNELVEFTGNTPIDQSFLDEETESEFDDAIAPLRAKAGIAVLIGLGGTLTGLTVGVQNLQRALPQPGGFL
jgi:hypothetical protein